MLDRLSRTLGRNWRITAALVVGLAVMLVGTAVFLSFQAEGAMKRVAAAFSGTARVEYQAPRAHWNGDLAVKRLRITPLAKDHPASLVAERATLHAPSFIWLIRAAFGSSDAGLPKASSLGLTLDGVHIDGNGGWLASADWLGPASGAPFEALGCPEKRRFEFADFAAMTLDAQPGQLDARYRATSGNTGELVVNLVVPGSSHAEHRRILSLPDPTQPLAAAPSEVAITEQTWTIRDDGFVQARNRYCARRARLTRNQFVDRHVRLVERWLSARGLVAGDALVAEYGRYVARGGVLKWRSKPATRQTLAELKRLAPSERIGALHAALAVNDRPAVAFDFAVFVPPVVVAAETTPSSVAVELVAPGSAMSSTVVPPASAAAPTPDAAPTTASAAPTGPAAQPPTPQVPVSVTGAPVSPAPTAATSPADKTPPAVSTELPKSKATTTAPTPVAAAPKPVEPKPVEPKPAEPKPAEPKPVQPEPAASEPAAPAPVPSEPLPAEPKPSVLPAQKTPARVTALQPGPVEYTQLARAIGRRVSVLTVFNSHRAGVLKEYNGSAITIELSMRDGGMSLTVPRETIKKVELTDSD